MKVLVFNSGTDSLRSKVIDTKTKQVLFWCKVEKISTSNADIEYCDSTKNTKIKKPFSGNFEQAVETCLSIMTDKTKCEYIVFRDLDAIGHRVVFGGDKYPKPIIVNEDILHDLKNFSKFAPIHNNKAVNTIEVCSKEISNISNVAVFDSSFHMTIPDYNYRYAIPNELYTEKGIRKFGFHGISYQNVLKKLPNILNKQIDDINVVIAHLGSGCSMCCVKNGKSYDTTMGFSPLDGLMMSTRSGSIDPSILPVICEHYNCDLKTAIEILNMKSGYYGICGEKDIYTLCNNSDNGDKMAKFARVMAAQSFKKNLGAMLSELNSIDAIVITGGMGIKNDRQRELFLSNLEVFGIEVDKFKNKSASDKVCNISSSNSKIKLLVVPSDEEMEIAKETETILGVER